MKGITWYEVYDYLDGYFSDSQGDYVPNVIYRTASKYLADRICEIAKEIKSVGVPFVKEVHSPVLDYKFYEDASEETIREWYRTERQSWLPQ